MLQVWTKITKKSKLSQFFFTARKWRLGQGNVFTPIRLFTGAMGVFLWGSASQGGMSTYRGVCLLGSLATGGDLPHPPTPELEKQAVCILITFVIQLYDCSMTKNYTAVMSCTQLLNLNILKKIFSFYVMRLVNNFIKYWNWNKQFILFHIIFQILQIKYPSNLLNVTFCTLTLSKKLNIF